LAIIAVDDLTSVVNLHIANIGTTCRASSLFEYLGVLTPELLTAIGNLTTYSHEIGSGIDFWTNRTYIWNTVTLVWDQLASLSSLADPRTILGDVAANFDDYVDGSNRLYILHWDFEGSFRSGGGGCVHEDSMLLKESGESIPVSALVHGQEVLCWAQHDDTNEWYQTDRVADEITKNYPQEWPMVRLVTAIGSVVVTDNHLIPTETGEKRADAIVVADKLLGLGDVWLSVTAVESYQEVCAVYDVWVRGAAYFVAPGIAINVMNHHNHK